MMYKTGRKISSERLQRMLASISVGDKHVTEKPVIKIGSSSLIRVTAPRLKL